MIISPYDMVHTQKSNYLYIDMEEWALFLMDDQQGTHGPMSKEGAH